MKKNWLLIILIACIVQACNDPVKKNQKIEITPDNFINAEFTLSDFVDEIKYVQLDSTIMIRKVINKEIIDDLIFIAAWQEGILVYDMDGNFINRIGKIGKGPGEYMFGNSFAVDSDRKRVFVADFNKLMVFDYAGKLIKETKTNLMLGYSNVMKFKDGYLYLFMRIAVTGAEQKYSWMILDTDVNIVGSKTNEARFKFEEFVMIGYHGNCFYEFNQKFHYWNHFNDTIFELNGLSSKPKFIFKNDRYRIRPEMFDGSSKKVNTHDYFMPLNINESNKKIFISYYLNERSHICVYDKKDQKFETIELGDELGKTGILNDIDGGFSFRPKTYYSKDGREYMVDEVDALSFKEYLEEVNIEDVIAKDKSKKKAFFNMVKAMDESNNVVLVFCRLKK